MNSEQNVKGLLSVWKLDGRDAFIMRALATLWSIKALFFFLEKDWRGQGMTKQKHKEWKAKQYKYDRL